MNLQPTKVDIVSQKEFLRNTLDMQFKTAGAVLDMDEFVNQANEAGYVPAGTAVMQDTDGYYVPFSVGADENVADVKGAGLTTTDVPYEEGTKELSGILIAGHPLEEKCTNVNDSFKEAVKGYIRFDV